VAIGDFAHGLLLEFEDLALMLEVVDWFGDDGFAADYREEPPLSLGVDAVRGALFFVRLAGSLHWRTQRDHKED
jgi:hypothetical protein